MKIAFVHYHLKTGGVSTVIEQQVAALQHVCECLVLTGDRATAKLPCKVIEIHELGYDQPGALRSGADEVAERVQKALQAEWPGGCDVLHIHNPILAKNRQFLQIIKRLQQFGTKLFLQIHDFAEDGRPESYFEEEYPADCHYGVLNARDAAVLKKAGLDDVGIHCLPNAVHRISCGDSSYRIPQILYPVRAIRRKNLGEAILLTLFFRNGQRLAVTQPPNSPTDVRSYRDWVRWVGKHNLPVDFEVGTTMPFPELVATSESILTTSITEGFGFSFLEPWTAGKLLWGRRIEGVCADFTKKGIWLDYLYDRLDLPLAWIDLDAFSHSWEKAISRVAEHYDHIPGDGKPPVAFARLMRRETIDFGLLNETFQRQVIQRILSDPAGRATLIALNPWLANPGVFPDASTIIDHNRRAVLEHFAATDYRARLLSIYDQVLRHPVRHHIDKTVLLKLFLDLDRFPLLKWGAYE